MRGDRSVSVRSLLPAIIGGDEVAWTAFAEMLWEGVEVQLRRGRILGPLRSSPDECREVTSLVFARLRRDGFRALALFGDWHRRHPAKDFDDWLAIVAANVARDYMSRRLTGDRADGKTVVRLAETLADSADDWKGQGSIRPPITNQIAAIRLLERAKIALPVDQFEALVSWIRGHDFDEIARMQGLGEARQARVKVRAALARLRYALRG
jgi:hypothetical protein